MADRALRFDLLGRDRTLGRTLGQAEGRFRRFGGAAVKMGTVISGAFAGIAIGGFLKDAIAEAREAQKVGRQTAAVIKATGGVAKVSARDVDRLATALSNKVGVDDEVIAAGANMMLTFKGVRNEVGKGNDVFNQASAVALDMTAALNQGEVSQSGLEQSTIRLGKALNDPIKGVTALTRVGVTFTEKQKDQIKTLVENGRTMDAQKIILAELKSEFGGAAAAAADPWQRFGVVMGNLKEQLGTALLPVLTRVADFLSRNLPRAFEAAERLLRPLAERVGELARGWYTTGREVAGALVEGVQSRFNQWRPSLVSFRDNLVKGVRRFSKPIIAALTTGVKTGNWEPLGKALGDALGAALRGAGDVAATVVAWLKVQFGRVDWVEVGKTVGGQAFGFLVGFVSAFGSDLIKVAREHPLDLALFVGSILAVGKIGGIIAKVLSKIPFLRAFAPLFEGLNRLTAPVNNAIGRLVGLIGTGFREGLERVFPTVAKRLQGLIGDMLAWISLRAEAFRNTGMRLIKGLAVGIGEQVGLVVKNIGQVIRFLTRPFTGAAGWLVRRGIEVVTGLVSGIIRLLSSVARTAARVIEVLTRPFRSAAGWLVQRGSQAVDGLVRGVVAAFGRVSAAVRGVITRVVSPFGSSLRWLSRAGQNIVDGLISGMRSAMGSIGGIVRSLRDAIVGGIKRLFGIRSPSTVMAGLGANMVAGLVKGLISNQGTLGAILKSIGGDITEAFAGFGGGGTARGLVGFARSAFGLFSRMFPGMTIGGWRARGSVPGSDHPKGKALDLMTTNGFVANAIISMFRMLPGAKYWIWNRQIASAPSWQRRGYSGPSPHTDHVHLSFFDQGGFLPPHSTTLAVNRTSQWEPVGPPGAGGEIRLHPDSIRALARALQGAPLVVKPADLHTALLGRKRDLSVDLGLS